MKPSARSFVLDLLSTLRRGTMPVAALVTAAAPFGIAENSVRVALARLRAAGQVERDERGRYRLGPGAAPVERRVGGWRRNETRRWHGAWIGVSAGRPRRRSRERALRLLGFEDLRPGLAIRPDNLRAGAPELRSEFSQLGLEADALLFTLADLDPAADARARGLWDVDALRRGYRGIRAALATSEARLPELDEDRARVETFQLGGAAIRQLVLDPRLPEEFGVAAEREALVQATRHYDELGRACWAPLLARFQIPHARTPVDARLEQRAALG